MFEYDDCSSIAQFRLSCAGFGNKAPRFMGLRQKSCLLCGGTLDELHVAFVCSQLERLRLDQTLISSFRAKCHLRGLPLNVTYRRFVNGLDEDGKQIELSAIVERGEMLTRVKHSWLELAGYLYVLLCLFFISLS